MNSNLIDSIKNLAKNNNNTILDIRHHLHANPELSFQEFETSKYVKLVLENIGISKIEHLANTGIVACIEGKNPSHKTIALRADLDALPITELNNITYKSKNEGVMHACGHDVHSSCLLGAAQILFSLKDEFEGTIKLVFQPGEEKLPGGASIMIQEGVLKNPDVDTIIGQHVMPLIPVGKVGFKSGLYMASTDELYVKVIGKGGHGAMPQLNIDPVVIAAQIIVSLQQIVSRMSSPIIPSVLSFGKVIANGATNIIPNEVIMEGTFRTLDEKWRLEAHEKMVKMATMIAESMGGKCEFEVRKGYPFLHNNEAVTEKSKQHAIAYLGSENVLDLDIWMAAEDFAYYSQIIPACFYRLGTRNEEKGIVSSVHTPTFNIDENALEIGSGLMTYLAIC
ncbi:MAG: amidohydrolase, partial [Bacteroidia bacterium]|nr:amidohydrolase [Bacteroidia bacterium]